MSESVLDFDVEYFEMEDCPRCGRLVRGFRDATVYLYKKLYHQHCALMELEIVLNTLSEVVTEKNIELEQKGK